MKKLTTLLLLIFSLLAFNNCSDEVTGTKDINYVSFEVNSPTIIVEKNKSTDAKVHLYATQTTGSDRTFGVGVIAASTTVAAAAYTVPATVTIPANSNDGTLTVTVSDNSLSNAPVTLGLKVTPTTDVFIGNNASLKIQKHCTLNIDQFVGKYTGNTPSDGPTRVVVSKNSSGNLQITGIGVGWMTGYWGEDIVTMATLPMVVDLATGNFTIALAPYMTTTWGGDPQPGYSLSATGTLNACEGKMYLYYKLFQGSTTSLASAARFTEIITPIP
ncbi:MAG TPA: hypothetical protein VIK10_07435 [Prolixibacteraceae bacterium]